MSGFDTKVKNNKEDQLITPNFPLLQRGGTLIMGQSLLRGAVLGIITASGKFTGVDDSQATGEEIARAVLLEDSDATSADLVVPFAIAGEFVGDEMDFGPDSQADHELAMREKSLFIVNLEQANP